MRSVAFDLGLQCYQCLLKGALCINKLARVFNKGKQSGPAVIKEISCSTHLSMESILLKKDF